MGDFATGEMRIGTSARADDRRRSAQDRQPSHSEISDEQTKQSRALVVVPAHAASGKPDAHSVTGQILPLATTRADSGFLTQYVDQHYPWPRNPGRKQRQRHRAARAYVEAEGLPDLLIETLRLHVDRKL